MSILHLASLTERIPTEIWTEICIAACTDTGFTGRSLACLSQFFRLVSQPVQYQSIALHGFEQIIAFASILDRTPTLHCQVKYLFITKAQPPRLSENYETDPKRRESVFNMKEVSDAFWTIMTATSPTIEILHLNFAEYEHHPIPFGGFPRLRELQSDGLSLRHSTVSSSYPIYPVLRYWNINTVPPPSLNGVALAANWITFLPSIAPSLSHFQVPEYCFMPDNILEDFARTLLGVALQSHGGGESSPLPMSVEKVFVKPRASSIMGSLLRPMNKRGDARFVLLPLYRWDEPSYGLEAWLDRVDGGEGCWSLRDRLLPEG